MERLAARAALIFTARGHREDAHTPTLARGGIGMQDVSFAAGPIAVIKLGGSILTNTTAYKRAAVFVRNRHHAAPEEKLVVVVSAQEGATDYLERAAKKIAREPRTAILNLLWSTGEIRSVAL